MNKKIQISIEMPQNFLSAEGIEILMNCLRDGLGGYSNYNPKNVKIELVDDVPASMECTCYCINEAKNCTKACRFMQED